MRFAQGDRSAPSEVCQAVSSNGGFVIDHAAPVAPSDSRFGPDRTNFLTSHRAQSVGAREFGKFADSVVALARRAATEAGCEAPTLRMSPDRCIVQLGPVALTVAHIHTGNDVPPGGQLLAIIWNGIDSTGYTSPELAERCVAQLQTAFDAALRDMPPEVPLS